MGRVDSEDAAARDAYNHRIRQSWGNETHSMLDLPDNELFSAYIDGELTADEQAEVEQILNDNPDAQQLVDELRSLSLSLQALPAYKLDQDLAERVLLQAEREMLAHPDSPLPKFHQVDVLETRAVSWARRFLRPRTFAWSAMAILVAALLMFDESDTNNKAPDNNVAQAPGGVTIEPLDIGSAVEAVENPPIPTVVHTSKPDKPTVDAPDAAAPSPDPALVANTLPDTDREPNQRPVAPARSEVTPLLVLQCELAEGRIGPESLAGLLKDAGVAVHKPLAEDGGPIELTLTTDQVLQVMVQLREGSQDFTGFSFLPTSKTAPPRIPSGIGPAGSHSDETTTEQNHAATDAPKATIHVQGAITIRPQVPPVETTAAGGNSNKATVTAEKVPATNPSLKDHSTYRVRFLLRSPEKAAKSGPPANH